MSGRAFKQFIDPLSAVFDKPPGENPAAFFAALAEEMEAFSDDRLEAAVKLIRANRKYRTFPTIAECKTAVMAAVVDGDKPAQKVGEQPRISRDAWIRARQLCRSDIGGQADKSGWLPALLEFCEANGRLPSGNEIDRVKDIAARSEEALSAARGGPLFGMLCKFRETMLTRAHTQVFGDDWRNAAG